MEGQFRFATAVEVRWRDLDALGHVNNAVYMTYLEKARVDYLRELGLVTFAPGEIGLILAEVTCTYRAPISLGEAVTVCVRVSELRRSSFIFEYRMEGEGGRLVATAHTVQVCYDYQLGRSMPIPDHWRETIVEYEPGLQNRT
ncbi:MAG: acyl-CoA thioesterase [Anaerolineae bacterium]|nr:acyl-CoA thioesterase [Anaerolineae bacterium]